MQIIIDFFLKRKFTKQAQKNICIHMKAEILRYLRPIVESIKWRCDLGIENSLAYRCLTEACPFQSLEESN